MVSGVGGWVSDPALPAGLAGAFTQCYAPAWGVVGTLVLFQVALQPEAAVVGTALRWITSWYCRELLHSPGLFASQDGSAPQADEGALPSITACMLTQYGRQSALSCVKDMQHSFKCGSIHSSVGQMSHPACCALFARIPAVLLPLPLASTINCNCCACLYPAMP